jgi:hypothetical protein
MIGARVAIVGLGLHIDPCPMGVAGMATASSSFPPLIGP